MVRRLAFVVAVMVAVVVGLAAPASAHALLDATSPTEGSTVDAPPKRITLTFSESVEISLGAVRLFDAAGKEVDLPKATHPNGRSEVVEVAIPTIGRGTYVVDWRVTSADSHPVNGAFTFNVGAPSDGTNARGLVSRLVNDQGSTTVGVLFAVVRWLGYATVALVFGGLIFAAWLWPGGAESALAARHLRLAAIVGTVAALVAIAFQGAYAGGYGIGQVLRPSLWGDVIATRYGQAHLVQAVAMVIAAAVASRLRSSRTWWWQAAAVGTGVVLAAAITFAGHGDTGRWRGVAVAADMLHVGAFSVWIGGLFGLVAWALRGERISDGVAAARAFSTVALAAIAVLVASGTIQGVRQVGDWGALTSSTYGRLLLVKVGVVVVILGVAWVSRSLVRELAGVGAVPDAEAATTTPEPGSDVGTIDDGVADVTTIDDGVADVTTDDGDADPSEVAGRADVGDDADPPEVAEPHVLRSYLRRSVAVEVVGVVVVLVVSTLLSSVIPARETIARPFAQTVVTDQGFAQVSLDPARVGQAALHVTITKVDGTVPDIAQLTVEMNLPEREIGPLEVPMTALSANHFVNENVTVPVAGRWQLTLAARIGDFDQLTFKVDVPVDG